MTVDSSAWTGRPSALRRDECGVSDWDWHEMRSEEDRIRRRDRWQALVALWWLPKRQPPRRRSEGWTVHDGHERNRDEEWTLWRALLATVAIVTGRDHTQRQVDRYGHEDSWNIAYFGAGATYGGYDVMVVQLYPRCRISIFSDGECWM